MQLTTIKNKNTTTPPKSKNNVERRENLFNVKSIWNAQKHIEKLIEKKAALLETLTLHGVSYDQIRAGQHGTNQDSAVEDLIIAVENIDAEIAQILYKKAALQVAFIKLFEKVLPDEVLPLFIWRYVNLAEWKGIIAEMDFSETHIHQLHRKYLPKVEEEIKKCQSVR